MKFCIKSNGLELYEDLVTTIEEDKNYLAFVDDANELMGLHFCSGFSAKTADQKKSVKKLIVTVRDYTPTSDKSNTGSKETINYKGRMPNDDEIRKLIKEVSLELQITYIQIE